MSLNARALTRLLLNERSSLTRLVQRIVGAVSYTHLTLPTTERV